MKVCFACGKNRLIEINGKTSDCFGAFYAGKSYDGYVPCDLGIGGGDYIDFKYCLECGKIQGKFPIDESVINEQLEFDQEDSE